MAVFLKKQSFVSFSIVILSHGYLAFNSDRGLLWPINRTQVILCIYIEKAEASPGSRSNLFWYFFAFAFSSRNDVSLHLIRPHPPGICIIAFSILP